MAQRICSIDGCERLVKGRNWCFMHYQRWRRHGDPLRLVHQPRAISDGQLACRVCNVVKPLDDFYELKSTCRECTLVARRARYVSRRRTPVPWTDPHGYVRVSTGKGPWVSEHRVVMAQVLGRPLRRDEEVHHRNGVRNDNRPENLELWLTSQPAGQRVTDLVAWAHEILDRYENVSLPGCRKHRTSDPSPGSMSGFG